MFKIKNPSDQLLVTTQKVENRRGFFIILYNNNSIYSEEKSSVLIDKTKIGKVRPWREKKIASVGYFELLHILVMKKSICLRVCAYLLVFKEIKVTEERKLNRVWFCTSSL